MRRRCLDCSTLIETGSRCDAHRLAKARAKDRRPRRRNRKKLLYTYDHVKERKAWFDVMSKGAVILCWRCLKPVNPLDFDLDHSARNTYYERSMPTHPACNRGDR